MKIKEMEIRSGVRRANIRFYEKEGLFIPDRNKDNGYKEYSENDLNTLKKIKVLRSLDFSLNDIHEIFDGNANLCDMLQKHMSKYSSDVETAREKMALCQQLIDNSVTIEDLSEDAIASNNEVVETAAKAVIKTDVDRFIFIKGSLLMLPVAAFVAFYVRGTGFVDDEASIWVLPYVGVFFLIYAAIWGIIEGKDQSPFLWVGRGPNYWRAPGMGILTNSFSLAGLGIGFLATSIPQFILYYLAGCAVFCGIRGAFNLYYSK